jgi:hypothetical protein
LIFFQKAAAMQALFLGGGQNKFTAVFFSRSRELYFSPDSDLISRTSVREQIKIFP